MLLPLPVLNVGFCLLTVMTIVCFFLVTGRNRWLLTGLLAWTAVVGGVAATGFFTDTHALPPRLALVMVPMLVAGILLGFTRLGRPLRDAAALSGLHYLQGVRIVVEVIFLHGLYTSGYVAKALTYEGYNFDIVPGILGVLLGYIVFNRKWLSVGWALAYNVFGIAVLLSTIAIAILSTETAYQQFGFDQPTVAIFYLPFVWLPALVAPLMLWVHFLSIGILLRNGSDRLTMSHHDDTSRSQLLK